MTKKKEKTTKYGLQNSENTTRLASRKGLVASHLLRRIPRALQVEKVL
jgi:hypothetical protein